MKLKDLTEAKSNRKQEFDEWYKNNRFTGKTKELQYTNSKITIADPLKVKSSLFKLNGHTTGEQLSGPRPVFKVPEFIKDDDWTMDYIMFENYTFDNFEDLPNVKKLAFRDCTFKSLKGIENKSILRVIQFGAKDPEDMFDCGVLRLLKAPDLQNCTSLSGGDPKMGKLCSIIDDHFQHRDMVEAQSDLIDAGLEEFAKL